MVKAYHTNEVVLMLVKAQGEGTQKELAERIGCTQQYLSDVLKGRRDPGPKILSFLRLEPAFTEKA